MLTFVGMRPDQAVDPIERLRRRTTVTETGCFEWEGSRGRSGYGSIVAGSWTDGTRRSMRTHRLSWEIHFGPIPDGISVLHRCDNPPCWNPEHLFLGTPADNSEDSRLKGRHARAESHGRSPFMWPDIHEIRRRRSQGETLKSIALSHGVSVPSIRAICLGKTWIEEK